MKKFDNSGKDDTGKSSSTMRKLLSSGSNNNPAPFGGKSRPLTQYILPAALVVILLIGVAILAYSFGVSRGRNAANNERDQFYEGRAASWVATATAQASAGATPAGGAKPGNTFANSTYGRVDKVDSDQVTVLLLNDSGSPTGTNLVITVGPQTKVWRNVPNQPAELKPGDTILFTGERNDKGLFDARSVLILPAS